MKKKIIVIVTGLILIIAVIVVSKMMKKTTSDYEIGEILESNVLILIYENYYGEDIALYSSRDKEGNEWIYRRTSNRIVLTEEGVLCKYTQGSYRKDVEYSGCDIIKAIELSNKQVEEITKKIEELASTEFDNYKEVTEYMVSQKEGSKRVRREELNEVLKEYGLDM